jgi:hypothetical protein
MCAMDRPAYRRPMHRARDFLCQGPSLPRAPRELGGRTRVGPRTPPSFVSMPESSDSVVVTMLTAVARCSEPAERIKSIRMLLAGAPPLQALSICYSHEWAAFLPKELADKVRECGSRGKLLAWIYGDPRLYRDATYLHLPSTSKRAFMGEILAACQTSAVSSSGVTCFLGKLMLIWEGGMT